MNNILKSGFYIACISLLVACQPSVYVLDHADLGVVSVNDTIVDDPEIAAIIEPYKVKLDQKMSRVIGYSPINMYSSRTKEQTEIGNLLADINVSMANKYYKEKVDLGVMTAGGIRAPLTKGDITVGSIFELMPFENELVVIKVTGDTLLQLLTTAADRKSISFSKTCELEFTSGKVTKAIINNREVKKDEVYSIAISDYLANGGDGLSFFANPKEYTILNIKVRDSIIEYIEEMTKNDLPIKGEIDNRVIFK